MKSGFYRLLLLTAWFAGLGLTASAQTITNADFENWAVRGTAEAPANWLTTDDIFEAFDPGFFYNTGTVTKSTDAHGGSFAAKLSNVSVGSGTNTGVVGGVLVLGTKLGGEASYNRYPIGGVPYTSRPTQVQFYYKLTIAATDTAFATAIFTKKDPNGGLPLILGGGTIFLTPTMGTGYVGVTADVPYSTSTDAPDSVRIQFSTGCASEFIRDALTAGTTLSIDDVSFLGAPLATRANATVQELLTVSPNPGPAGHFQLHAPAEPALASAPYSVFDLTGRLVAQQPALAVPTPTRDLDLSRLATGVYLLRLDSKQGTLVRQLVVQ